MDASRGKNSMEPEDETTLDSELPTRVIDPRDLARLRHLATRGRECPTLRLRAVVDDVEVSGE